MDGIELQLFRRRLGGVAEEMGEVLRRGAFSPNIKERLDHSCAIFDARGDMIAQAAHIPVHLGATPLCVKAVIDRLTLDDGQTAIVNDPFSGGTHLPDVTLVTAVVLGGDRYFVASRAHHADVGGISPGSLPLSRTIDDEGWRCAPTRLTDAVEASLCSASRTPRERRGDLAAQRAANRRGVARLRALGEEFGAGKLREASSALMDYTERMMDAVLRGIPGGTWAAEQSLEGTLDSDEPVALRVTMTVADGRVCFDFRDSDDQVAGPTNAVRAIVESAVFYILLCLSDEDVPANGGVMRRVTVLTRKGSVLDAEDPAAVAAGNVETSQRIVDLLMEVLAHPLGSRVPALACGSMNNVLIGYDETGPERVAPFVYYETIAGGYGGGRARAGASATHAHMTNTRNTPVEAFEHAYPVRIVRYRLRDGSGGSGTHPGGEGVERVYEFTTRAIVTILAERRVDGPTGRSGGGSGAPGRQWLRRPDGTEVTLSGKATVTVEAGWQLVVMTPGGGGWGA